MHLILDISLSTSLAVNHKFWYIAFYFSFSGKYSLLSLETSFTHEFCLTSKYVLDFQLSLLLTLLWLCLPEHLLQMISIFFNLLRLVFWFDIWPILWIFYVQLRSMCILLLGGNSIKVNYASLVLFLKNKFTG